MTDRDAGAPPPLPARSLEPDEVEEILYLAGRREVTSIASEGHLTVSDLMAAAAEAGLDPAEVRRAAALQRPVQGSAAEVVFGAPGTREVRAHLPHATIPENRRELVHAIERGLGRRGEVRESDPDRFVWREDHTLGRTTVELRAVPGGIDVEARADRVGYITAGWFGGWILWAVAWSAFSLTQVMPPLATLLSMFALPLLAGRPFWARADRHTVAQLEDTTLELLRVVETATPRLPGPEPEAHSGAG